MSDWTPETLHAHFCELIRAHHDHVEDVDQANRDRLSVYITHHTAMHDRSQVHVDGQVRELIEQLRRENGIRADAVAEAISKAEQANDKRFESVNEFRSQLSDQAATFIRREEYLTGHSTLAEKLDNLGSRLDRIEGKSVGGSAFYGYMVAGVGLLGTIITIVVVLSANNII